MANSFNISVAPEVAALRAVVDDIHDTDLPGVTTIVTQTGILVLDIHDTDLPAVGVLVNTVDTVVDAIRATDITTITNAIAAINIRGQFKRAYLANADHAWNTVINIASGGGKLIAVKVFGVAAGQKIRVTIDGLLSNELDLGDSSTNFIIYDSTSTDVFQIKEATEEKLINAEFKTSMKVESYGAGSLLHTNVFYNDD